MNFLADVAELVRLIKKASVEATEATKPVQVCFGKVTSVAPLKILVEQKITLGEAQLIFTRNVTDFTTEVTIDWLTEERSGGSGEAAFSSHNHKVAGRKKIIVHNGLVVGDEVILFRQQEGQKYIVIDRIGK